MENYQESLEKWQNYYNRHFEEEAEATKRYKKLNFKRKYDQLINAEAELIKTICGKNLSFANIFTTYYYLVWNGYFSEPGEFQFAKPATEIDCELGASIIAGTGVCRNIASHFQRIINQIRDEYSYCIAVHANPDDLSESILLDHVNVLIFENNRFWIVDPTNFIIYGLSKAEEISDVKRVELRINLNASISDDIEQRKKILEGIDRFNHILSRKKKTKIDEETLKTIKKQGKTMCITHMEEIEKFRNEYSSLYKLLSANINITSKIINPKK